MKKLSFKKSIGLMSLLIFILAFTASCGSSKNSESFESYTTDTAYSEEIADESDDYGAYDYADNEVIMAERQIIKRASMDVETRDFDEAVKKVKEEVEKNGGYISGSTTGGSKTEGTRYANFTCRIPSESYENFISGSGNFGNVTYLNESEEDVTEEYIDLDARINNLEAQLEKLNELLDKAESLEDMLTIQGYITDTQYELDSYTGRMKALSRQVSFSTVNVSVDEVAVYSANKDSFASRIGNAFFGMWESFVNFLQNFVISLIYALPYLIIIAAAVVVIIVIKRKRKAKLASLKENGQEQKR